MNTRTEEALQLHLREEEAMTRVRVNRSVTRPRNTGSQYAPKQLEYITWNEALGYPDERVTEAKMVLFITHIQNRPPKGRGRKRKLQPEAGEGNLSENLEVSESNTTKSVGFHTVAAYVNAIMDLWRVQYELQSNDRVPIRPSSVKELLKQKKVLTVQEEDKTFVDRGIGTMVDNIDGCALTAISNNFFSEGTEQGMKHRAAALLSVALACRGDNLRSLRLSTIGIVNFKNEGVRGAYLLRSVWRKSKKNQYGNAEQTTTMRHKDASRCPFGALAAYFFYRWHVGDEPWPDFSAPSQWYDIYVLKGSSPVTPMLYAHQYKAIRGQQELLGIHTTIRTQNGRKLAATAENEGARGESVDKQGHWATKSRNGAYANHVVPWDCVRVLAGFGPESNRYYIPRDLLQPPPELACLVFPQIESSRKVMLQARDREIAGTSFLDLMVHMRTVLLQDAVVLMENELYKNHPLF
jgi:hypothetical protein